MDWRLIVGGIAVIVSTIGYIPYFRNVFIGHTKPHAFSWLIWSVLTGSSSVAQIFEGAGAGAWVTVATSITTGMIFVLSLRYGTKDITRFDWFILLSAIISLLPWLMTNDPFISVILITVIQASGFLPTIRKVYKLPNEETGLTFISNGLKFYIGIIALSVFNVETLLFPVVIGIANFILAGVIFTRRRQLQETDEK